MRARTPLLLSRYVYYMRQIGLCDVQYYRDRLRETRRRGGQMTRFVILLVVLAMPAWAQDSSADHTQDYQREALTMFRDLIAMRTAEGHGKVPAMAAYLEKQFLDAGFYANEVKILPHSLPSGEEVASLVVRYRGNGLSGKKPILLLAHMDIVDANPSDWERDPFTLIEEDGYFFGRGTLDNKLGIVALTSAFQRRGIAHGDGAVTGQ